MDRNGLSSLCVLLGCVALRKESVDRNVQPANTFPGVVASLSARRAWIEITLFCPLSAAKSSRSPQGERG